MADESHSKYISMREAARLCGVPVSTFRASYLANFYPFRLHRVSTFRNKFLRADVEAFVEAQETRIVELPEGEQITAASVESGAA